MAALAKWKSVIAAVKNTSERFSNRSASWLERRTIDRNRKRTRPWRRFKAKLGPMSAQGVVKQPIHGPKGEVRGAVLEDGRIIRLPPHEAERFSELLKKGAKISVTGEGAATSFGTVLEARQIGSSAETMTPIGAKKPKHGPDHKGPKHHGKKHGPKHDSKHRHEEHAK